LGLKKKKEFFWGLNLGEKDKKREKSFGKSKGKRRTIYSFFLVLWVGGGGGGRFNARDWFQKHVLRLPLKKKEGKSS